MPDTVKLVLADLRATLPDRHPIVERVVDMLAETVPGAKAPTLPGGEYGDLLEQLVGQLEDWRRGVRDWPEVEVVLADARRLVGGYGD